MKRMLSGDIDSRIPFSLTSGFKTYRWSLLLVMLVRLAIVAGLWQYVYSRLLAFGQPVEFNRHLALYLWVAAAYVYLSLEMLDYRRKVRQAYIALKEEEEPAP